MIDAAVSAGLEPIERCLALIAAVRDGQLITRPSFFQLANIRNARAAGVPLHLIVAEDVLIFRAPSGEPKAHKPIAEAPATAGAQRARCLPATG